MPAPQASMMSQIAIQHFTSLAIRLPQDWTQPTGDAGHQYVDAFEPPERAVPVPPLLLFVPASNNKLHVDTCVDLTKKFKRFFEETSKAICQAWQQWQMAAQVTGVMINGPVGTVTPGCLVGPPIGPMAMPPSLKDTPMLSRYSMAVITAFNEAWTTWVLGFSGMLNYPPTFAMCPMPMHPPCPNISAPIQTVGASPGEAMLQPAVLKMSMVAKLGDPTAAHHKELFESMSEAIKKCFDLWKTSTMVSMVMGTGPVPTFAPPIVPGGPVLAGMGFSAGTALT